MANNPGFDALFGSYQLQYGDDELDQDAEKPQKTLQTMQIDLARDTVHEMQRATRAGAQMSIGFGKHMVGGVAVRLMDLRRLMHCVVASIWPNHKNTPRSYPQIP